MFGLGFWEIALILGIALLVFGPAKLPELARSLGRGLREFRKATDDFKNTIDAELHADPDERPRARLEPEKKIPDTVARAPIYSGAVTATPDVVEAEVEAPQKAEDAPTPVVAAAAAAEDEATDSAPSDDVTRPAASAAAGPGSTASGEA